MTTSHEQLHERLMNGTADPGMYPDCAREMGMFDDRAPEPTSDEVCAIRGHEYLGDDGDRGRCYCGAKEYAAGGALDAVREKDRDRTDP